MYVIKSFYNGEDIYFISKQIEPRFKIPIVNFSNKIDKATKFDNLDIAIYECKKQLQTNFKVYTICPICGKHYSGHPAISSVDNKTEICSECGIKEALENFIRA